MKNHIRHLMTVALVTGACAELSPTDLQGEAASEELVEIVYRGSPRVAVRTQGRLLIEGDIEVSAADLEPVASPDAHDIGTTERGLKIQGLSYQWPNGIVPFTFAPGFTSDEVDHIERAMAHWEARVPGIDFVPRSGHADYINFRPGAVCSSMVGRIGGAQDVRLAAGCIVTAAGDPSFTVHHEIGHALGFYHQHTRKDRDNFVRIEWDQIIGCPPTADGPEDCGAAACSGNPASCGCTAANVMSCDRSSNFVTDAYRSNIGTYDYDSVMHYPARAFAKGTNDTITVLQTDPHGVPFQVGQRTRLSDRDVEAMRVMYPVARVYDAFFARTGTYELCVLEGRRDDIANEYAVGGGLPPAATSGRYIFTDVLSPGEFPVWCQPTSVFWASSYDYPNSSVVPFYGLFVPREVYFAYSAVRILSPGLIRVALVD